MITSPKPEPLKIEVAPNIVEHLGLNLYTNLPRVLVEFIANAYDADSPRADVSLDVAKIGNARKLMKEKWLKENAGRNRSGVVPLEEQTLPSEIQIIIEDAGHGMSRPDFQSKFLRIARKRREEESPRSPDGRVVMGRKGIGKLAGFGVAHKVEVISRKKGEKHATQITLEYEKLVGKQRTEEVEVPETRIEDGAGLDPHGTRVVLSKLVYEPTGSRLTTVTDEIADHFAIVKPSEFAVRLNRKTLKPFKRDFVFAYPTPKLDSVALVAHQLTLEDGRKLAFSYRIRFTGAGEQLQAGERGVRVYAHQRLASLPDLLDLGTGMHGFQNTHYLDGVVQADFIDEQRSDYIASNRQTLRWDTPLLATMREFLTDEMKKACIEYQDRKETTITKRVEDDKFTKGAIDEANLPPHRKSMAYRIAAKLASGCPDELKDKYYRETLPAIVKSLGYGELLSAIAKIACDKHPSFDGVVSTIAQLTGAEWGDFSRIVSGRIQGIEALRKIYKQIDFSKSANEGELHKLLMQCPWLIDATFWTFLTSNQTEKTLSDRLAKELKVGKYAPKIIGGKSAKDTKAPFRKSKRPDLVFLLSNYSLGRVVVVELKAPNTPLLGEHVLQLKGYMETVRAFLAETEDGKRLRVEGYLLGTRASVALSKTSGVLELKALERDTGPTSDWRVFDVFDLLKRAEDAHRELLQAYERAAKGQPGT